MNSVSLIGRLTRDPEIRYSSGSQTAVAKFTLAVNRPFAKEGEQDADFIGITCFGKTAELVERYMSKGRMVGVTGRIQTGSYEKDGRKVYTTDVIADRVEFLDRGNASSESYQQSEVDNPFDTDDQVPAGFAKLTDDDIPF
ncbi:MAG: single-stranded DNA-binding protein [Firmicutes bacterium]|nr:single-stranded DNA-binding protein [Bacillota bacterium]